MRRKPLLAHNERRTTGALQRSSMSDPNHNSEPGVPLAISRELRTMAHDLSNSLETIVQAAYLLRQTQLDDNQRKWLTLIEGAAHDSAMLNRQLREVLRTRSQQE
jgi:signal transduction histidine kinase